MKKFLLFLIFFFTTCIPHGHTQALSEKYNKLAEAKSLYEIQKEFIPIAVYSDGISLIDRDSRQFNWQLSSEDVVLSFPDGSIFFGFINVIEKGKEKQALKIIEEFKTLCRKSDYFPIHIGSYPQDLRKYLKELPYRGDSTIIFHNPFPCDIVFGYILDTLHNKSIFPPRDTIKNEAQTRSLLYGQWGKDNYYNRKVLGTEDITLDSGGEYNWKFLENGTGTVSWKKESEKLCPQKVAYSWRGGRYNKKHELLTGGYSVNFTYTETLSFSWRLNGNILYISYKSYSFSPIVGKPIFPKRSECATQTYFDQLCAQIKQDYPTNEDARDHKALLTRILSKQKDAFSPSEVPFTIHYIDSIILVVSNPDVDMITLTRNQSTGVKAIMKYNLDEVMGLTDGLSEYSNICDAYIKCIKASISLQEKREEIIPRFIQELKRPSSDKLFGLYGASKVLLADYYDDKNHKVYDELLSTPAAGYWMRDHVSNVLPFVDWRLKKINHNEYTLYFLKGKNAKKQKVYSTQVFLSTKDKIDCENSFVSIKEMPDIKWKDIQ